MKKLLSWGGASLITSAFMDAVFQWGLENPIPWGRDLLMGGAGIVCILLLVKYRRQL